MQQEISKRFQLDMERARESTIARQRKRRIGELVQLIDELSGEMGSAAFVEAIRLHGYNIEADLGALLRRGVDRMN